MEIRITRAHIFSVGWRERYEAVEYINASYIFQKFHNPSSMENLSSEASLAAAIELWKNIKISRVFCALPPQPTSVTVKFQWAMDGVLELQQNVKK